MSRSIQWNVAAYMISAALLASLFFSFNLNANNWNSRSSDLGIGQWHANGTASTFESPFVPLLPKPLFEVADKLPLTLSSKPTALLPQVKTPHIVQGATSSLTKVPSTVPVTTTPAGATIPATADTNKTITSVTPLTASSQPNNVLEVPLAASAVPSVPTVHTYEVTSFYLNVRALPNASSDILRTIEKGTLLQVLTTTESGWLSLQDGGYVSGRYANPVGDATGAKVTAPVVTAPSPAAKSAKSGAVYVSSVSAASRPAVHLRPTAADASDSLAENPVKPTSKVMSDSGMTAEHIAVLLKGTKLAGLGLEDVILEIEQKYGINAFFTIAVMKLESGNGKSTLARTKNNLFGLNAITGNAQKKAFTFATKDDCIRKFGQLISDKYVERGFTTIEKVASKYCPANGLWAGHVRNIMRSDYGKLT